MKALELGGCKLAQNCQFSSALEVIDPRRLQGKQPSTSRRRALECVPKNSCFDKDRHFVTPFIVTLADVYA
ncbi:unnamed protein product [Nippostrongylus brasiliensis]|uniref:Uncharacterized protein n=1 Tax=Nippostrongylus brasiliensis TaxID=27835 RepID=A0A0N4YPU5_NIPBR|nr:unnamed protein product [Nippostrongylus brasiliensis]